MVISVVKNENGMLAPNPNAEVRKQSMTDRKTLFAGDLTKKTNSVAQIRERAQKKAQKIISDVFDAEKELDEQVREMREKCKGLFDERAKDCASLKQVYADQRQLMEDNGITEDSEEYKDLELLRKERDAKLDPETKLTDEEKKQLERIHEQGLTKFQSMMLEKDEAARVYGERVEIAERSITQINSSLRDIHIERLKKDPMVDAQKTAEGILMAANDEVIGVLRKEGMEHIKEEIDEVVEKTKEAAEKRKEEEEKLEERKEKKEKLEEQIEKTKESVSDDHPVETRHSADYEEDMQEVIEAYHGKKSKADEELEQMIENLEMIMEDIKGAEVDINL